MKKFELSKKSWHWWIATEHGTLSSDTANTEIDLCTYTRHVVKGVFFLLLFVLISTSLAIGLGTIAVIPLGSFIGYVYACIAQGQILEMTEFSICGLVLIVLALFSWIIFKIIKVIENNKIKKRNAKINGVEIVEKDPGFLKLQLMRLKEKTCVMVNLSP